MNLGSKTYGITEDKLEELRELYDEIMRSPHSDFYREQFSGIRVSGLSRKEFTDIPRLSMGDFLSCPLKKRLYVSDRLLVKMVHKDGSSFFVARTLEDMGKEPFCKISAERPLVAFGSVHESLEKCLCFYERGILPLICEENTAITAIASKRYSVDALVADTESLDKLIPYLEKHGVLPQIKNIEVIDTKFNPRLLLNKFSEIGKNFILGVPETGAIAFACPNGISGGFLEFHPVKNSIVEITNGEIVVTRLIRMPTPVIRYGTGLKAVFIDKSCSCASESSFTLLT